jgi:hypothetical protein
MPSKVSANPSKRPSQRSRSPASQADFLARARANVPVVIPFQHPLSWWRTRPADQFKKTDVHIARHFLMGSAIIGERRLGVAMQISKNASWRCVPAPLFEGPRSRARDRAAVVEVRTSPDL